MRTWSGALPGASTVDLELVLTDAETGAVVARPRVRGASARMSGSWSPGDTDRDRVDRAIDLLHAYLVARRDGATRDAAPPK